ncbi:uncharacterized protein LOC143447466 isoform X2 [Clavelina lepadiformis]|uniref:uncharacterized protein LOC143447466 isoform X2 n=1 Tax=Clavelina lepadiformis TaxID=159417 RepID=UPI0040424A69
MWCCSNKERYLERYISSENVKKVESILQKGADPDERGTGKISFLGMAVDKGNEALVRLLMQAGASPNQRMREDKSSERAIDVGYPLQEASKQGDEAIVQVLLDYGADVNIGQDTRTGTALHLAAKHNHVEVARILLSHGADIIAIDRCLNTPLHLAAEHRSVTTAELLLQHGAPINAKNAGLLTSLHKAAGSEVMSQLLLDNGAHTATEKFGGSISRLTDQNGTIHKTSSFEWEMDTFQNKVNRAAPFRSLFVKLPSEVVCVGTGTQFPRPENAKKLRTVEICGFTDKRPQNEWA